ncbi:MAG: TMEM165/GDT1 family protein [Patescibacteria group bacterium]|nr:TMEM165/GDT1 family protein [Patescibacteria group bacterium]
MINISLPIILSTFAIIFIAELPDKTAFASLVLATKHKAMSVIIGACLAFVIQTLIAIFAGSLLTLLPAKPLHIAAGIGFLIFAFLALTKKENEKKVVKKEEKEIIKLHQSSIVTSFLVVFAAEWGDLTQLSTAALVARIGQPFSIAIGAIAALWSVTILAAVSGKQLKRRLSSSLLQRVSGILFATIGLIIIISTLLK